jgi:hypothetical protein
VSQWFKKKEFYEGLQAGLTSVGLFGAGVVSLYALWFWSENRIRVDHQVDYVRLGDDQALVRGVVTMTNIGVFELPIRSGNVRVHQVAPLQNCPESVDTGTECVSRSIKEGKDLVSERSLVITWPPLGFEPISLDDESDLPPNKTRTIQTDFILPSNVEAIELYTFIKNEGEDSKNVGWVTRTIHRLEGD